MMNAGSWSAAQADHTQRDLSWFDDSGLADVADDGTSVLFSDRFGVYLRGTDGSWLVHVGNIDAYADDLSPDGKKSSRPSTPTPAARDPAGQGGGTTCCPGITSRLTAAPGGFLADRIVFTGVEAGQNRRSYVQNSDWRAANASHPGGRLGAVTQLEGHAGGRYRRDHQAFPSARWTAGRPTWCLVPRRATGPSPGRQTTRRCGSSVVTRFHRRSSGSTSPQENARTGERSCRPTARACTITEFAITPSGDAYTYSYKRVLSQLYQVRGLR